MPKNANQNKKSRVRNAPNKNWTDEESLSMLFYVLDRQNEGKQFEKPTHDMFYERLIANLKWTNVKWKQVKAKMFNLRTKYLEVKKWLDGTGQGVDSGTIEAYKTSKCKFYDLLHCIYGGKANITVPCLYDSFQTNRKNCEMQTNVEESGQNNDGADVIGEIVIDEDGDVIANNLTDDDLDMLPVINVDSSSSAVETSSGCHEETFGQHLHSGSDTQHTQSDEGVECLGSVVDVSAGQERRSVPDTEDLQQSDSEVEYVGPDVGLPILRPTNSNSQTNDGARARKTQTITDDEMNFSVFASQTFDSDRADDHIRGKGSRIARFKKQLSERPSSQPHTRNIPSNAAAFVSDANLKRAETLHERNKIEMRRVENENMEIAINKERFELDKMLLVEQIELNKKEMGFKDNELSLKEKELAAKFDWRTQNFELKCKKLALKEKEKEEEFKLKLMELEKAERLEKMKIEYDYKLQLELAKMKSTR